MKRYLKYFSLLFAVFMLAVFVPGVSVLRTQAATTSSTAKKKNGWVTKGTATYYYQKGEKVKGFVKIGDTYYLFNQNSGMMYTDATMWVGDNSYGIPGGMYYFGKDGKMVSA